MWDEDEQWKFLISQISICNAVIYLVWKLYGTPQICTRIFSAGLPPLSNALHVHRVFQQQHLNNILTLLLGTSLQAHG